MKKRNKYWSITSIVVIFAFVLLSSTSLNRAHGFEWLFGNEESNVEELSDEDIQNIADVYYAIQQFYIEDISKDQLLEGALKGMVDSTGDPYSEYLNAQESADMNETVEGSFQGVGIQIMASDGQIVIVTPIDGTPASEAGIQPNDIILEADGTKLTGMNTNEVVELIRGQEGTTVNLVIQRGSSTFNVELERAEIPITTVTGELDEDNSKIGNVQITQFNGTTYDELVTAVEGLREEGATSFVFDLRYNPGGLLDQGLAISNMFLEDDDIIMQMEESGSSVTTYVANDSEYGDFQITEPYVLLINEGSASASEILTAAIKENTDAPIIGAKSFGKGSVQTILNATDFGELKLTFARWLTPSGEWIHDIGIEPTVQVEGHPIETAIILNSEEVLALGDGSDQVESLTNMLDAFGYELNVGTYFDDTVQVAVEKFQEDNELEVTGEVTGETATTLNTMAREYIQENDSQYDAAVDVLEEYLSEDDAA
ncbi:S41 family peptidase [Aerococcaceae bacterium DSM 111021]|nr:S41 family peptidase [Aerococcaceae bacterium DSM 111021]